jgi:hypothetical protein
MKQIYKIHLNGDAMINLNKVELPFRGTGFGTWYCSTNEEDLRSFLRANACLLDDSNEIIDFSLDFKGTSWGWVEEKIA